jgi:hypothetical protein
MDEYDNKMENEKEGEKDWAVCQAVDTLIKAEEIKKDATLMAKVAPELEKRKANVQTAIKSIAQLRKIANAKES